MTRGARSGQRTARLATRVPGVALALALVWSLVAGWLLLPTVAQAANPKAWVSVTIAALSPAVPDRDGTVRLTGTVKNTSDETLTRLQAVLWRSFDPILDREGMDQALESRANEPLGSRVKPQEIFDDLPDKADPTLGPGESAPFDLTADVADFGFPDADGVYLVGVQVRGRVGTDGSDEILGRGRIFLPLVVEATEAPDDPDDPAEPGDPADDLVPQQLTSVVLLNSRPSLVRTGLLADDHLATEVATGGRLRVLLEAAARAGVTYAIDPALVEELETMRRGYQVLGPDDTVSTGKGSVVAARWLDDFARLRAGADGFRTLYGSPDLTALIHANQPEVIAAAKAAGDQVETTKSLRLLVLPGAGRADRDTMAAAETLGATTILISENSARTDTPLLQVDGPTPVVTYAPTVLGGGPGPSPRRTAVKLRQRALAESYLAARAAPAAAPAQQVRLVSTAAQAAAVPTGATPFMQPRNLTFLLGTTPTPYEGDFAYGSGARDAELSGEQLDTIGRVQRSYTTYVDLFVNPARAQALRQSILPRTASTLFRGSNRAFERYTDAVEQQVTQDVRERILLVVTPRVQTTGRAAEFPITVRNKLAASDTDPGANTIKLELRFFSANSQRLTVEPIKIPDLAAGESTTVNARVRAETNGQVRVTAALYTTTGRALGESEPVLVNATQAGTIGWIIAIVAGAVLVGTTALRIRQVARQRKQDDPSGAETEPAPLAVSRPPVRATDTADPVEPLDPADPAGSAGPADRAGPAGETAGTRKDRDPLDV